MSTHLANFELLLAKSFRSFVQSVDIPLTRSLGLKVSIYGFLISIFYFRHKRTERKTLGSFKVETFSRAALFLHSSKYYYTLGRKFKN